MASPAPLKPAPKAAVGCCCCSEVVVEEPVRGGRPEPVPADRRHRYRKNGNKGLATALGKILPLFLHEALKGASQQRDQDFHGEDVQAHGPSRYAYCDVGGP